MFTGIITATTPASKVKSEGEGLVLRFQAPSDWNDLVLGESISTNGVCLTVSAIGDGTYDAYLMPETLRKTSFGTGLPDTVNLERALRAGDRFGGHFLQGHVDAVGVVVEVTSTSEHIIRVQFPVEYQAWVIYKGSIAIDGASLTVSAVEDNVLSVSLIPHTLEHTTLDALKKGSVVNLEFDVIGKYVAKSLEQQS